MPTLHDFRLTTIEGEDRSLRDFEGKVVLLVNVASKCGLTPQYDGLERLYAAHGKRGLEVLGVPCNQFAGQEPGSESEIASFCRTTYGVSFPMFAKVEVNGPGAHPLYQWLTSLDVAPEGRGDVKWNFGKFLIGRDGAPVARFEPRTEPQAKELVEKIESLL